MKKEISFETKKITPSELLKLCPTLIQFPGLTNRQKAFAWYYVNNGNDKTDAAIKAGYKMSKTGKEGRRQMQIQGIQNLQKPNIQKCIKVIVNDIINIKKLSLEHNIFEKLIKVINLDICDYLEDDGTVKGKLSDIPKSIRQMIKKTEIKYYGKNADIRVLSLDFLGKEWAFEKLMKYIDMVKDGDTNINVVSDEVKINLLNMLHGNK